MNLNGKEWLFLNYFHTGVCRCNKLLAWAFNNWDSTSKSRNVDMILKLRSIQFKYAWYCWEWLPYRHLSIETAPNEIIL